MMPARLGGVDPSPSPSCNACASIPAVSLLVPLIAVFYATVCRGSTAKANLAMGVIEALAWPLPLAVGKPFGVRPLRRRRTPATPLGGFAAIRPAEPGSHQ